MLYHRTDPAILPAGAGGLDQALMELVEIAARLLEGGSTLVVLYVLATERVRNKELVDWMMARYDKL